MGSPKARRTSGPKAVGAAALARVMIAAAARVVIVDDHELLRNGMSLMLGNEPGLEVCGEAKDEAEAIHKIGHLRPDVVVVDLSLQNGSGLEVIKWIRKNRLETRIVVSSMHDERLYGERALRAGANGYVSKQEPARTIIDAIRRVLEGKSYFSEELTGRMLQRATDGGDGLAKSPVDLLSDRELQVFRYIGQGLKSSQIAAKLFLATSTVDTYRERLKAKLKLQSGAELNREAAQWAMNNE